MRREAMYILDSDFLISAYRYDFPPGPNDNGFWAWLDGLGERHKIVIPEKVYVEIERGTDSLIELIRDFTYIKKEPTDSALPHLPGVLAAYGNLSQEDIEVLDRKADPYLVAHGLGLGAIVVTNETSAPNCTRPLNKKVPDICHHVGVTCMRYPRFLWELQRHS